MDVESRFSIKLSPEKLLDPKVKTVEGLVLLVMSEVESNE